MKVSIKPGTEKRGMVFKKDYHTVSFTVQMSEEEKAQAKAANILDHHMIAIPVDTNIVLDFSVKDFVNGMPPHNSTAYFENQVDAAEWQEEFKRVLKRLKETLEALDGTGEEEFEL